MKDRKIDARLYFFHLIKRLSEDWVKRYKTMFGRNIFRSTVCMYVVAKCWDRSWPEIRDKGEEISRWSEVIRSWGQRWKYRPPLSLYVRASSGTNSRKRKLQPLYLLSLWKENTKRDWKALLIFLKLNLVIQ